MITRLRQKSLPKAYSFHKHLEVHRAAWQRKKKVENEGNTNFYISGGLCLTSECVKLKLAGKTRKDASFLKAFCLHPSSTQLLSYASSLGRPTTSNASSLLAWCQYSELLQRQLSCLLVLCISHVQAHLSDSFVFPPLLF